MGGVTQHLHGTKKGIHICGNMLLKTDLVKMFHEMSEISNFAEDAFDKFMKVSVCTSHSIFENDSRRGMVLTFRGRNCAYSPRQKFCPNVARDSIA